MLNFYMHIHVLHVIISFYFWCNHNLILNIIHQAMKLTLTLVCVNIYLRYWLCNTFLNFSQAFKMIAKIILVRKSHTLFFIYIIKDGCWYKDEIIS